MQLAKARHKVIKILFLYRDVSRRVKWHVHQTTHRPNRPENALSLHPTCSGSGHGYLPPGKVTVAGGPTKKFAEISCSCYPLQLPTDCFALTTLVNGWRSVYR
jgi:hypothetical protein